ncbi:MAG: hypothetical protein NVS3B21_15060 [Acidimicrobiales bacterium]
MRFGQWAAAGTLAFLLMVGFVFPAPPAILFLGAVLGSLSALVAMSIVLVYRANRIINFAAGDLGAVASVLAVSLIVGPHVPYFLALLLGLGTALLLGAGIEFIIIRRFNKAPRLILTVVTIALSQLLAFAQLALPSAFGYTTAPQNFPEPFHLSFTWFPYTFRATHVLVIIIVPAVAAGLAAFFRFTRVGIAVRAAAESSDRAALLGIPVKRIGTIVWLIAGGLSGIAVLLRAPIVGVQIGSVLGPALLLRALAAAVIARMENLPVAFGAAVGLGMVEQAVLWHTGRTLLADPVLFAVIIGALLLQRKSRSRADDSGTSTWKAVREIRGIPRELLGVPEVRAGLSVIKTLFVGLLVIAPLVLSQSRINLLGVGLIFAMIAVSLVILTGWAGQISLGQLAFVAFGAAVAGTLSQHGWNFFICLLAAGLTGAVVAVIIGIPALRIQGPFLAVATLGFAIATNSYFLNHEFFPWLVPDRYSRVLRPTLFGKFDLESEPVFYVVILITLLLVLGSVSSFRHSRSGRTLVATRDNSRAAQSFGVSPTKARLTAFAFSGFIAALAGGLYVFLQHGVSNTILDPLQNILIFEVVVIGGLGSIAGGLFGAAYLTFLKYSPFTTTVLSQFLLSGFGVLAILLFLPGGLGGLLYDSRENLLRKIAVRKGIVVPSLLADVRVDDGAPPPVPEEALQLNMDGMEHDLEPLPVDDVEPSAGSAR